MKTTTKKSAFYIKRSVLWLKISAVFPFGLVGIAGLSQYQKGPTMIIVGLIGILLAWYYFKTAEDIKNHGSIINTNLLSKVQKIKWISYGIVLFTGGGGLLLLNAAIYLSNASSNIKKEIEGRESHSELASIPNKNI